MRARIDMSEVEARTKIRAKYLRAIENEEWDLLPGPIYVKSFLRTYGDFLGLDSRLLVDEYKRRYERPDHDMRPVATLSRERERAARGPLLPSWAIIGGVLVAVVVALYFIGTAGNNNKTTPDDERAGRSDQPPQAPRAPSSQSPHAGQADDGQAAARADRHRVRVPGRRHRQEADPRSDLQPGPDDPDADRVEDAADARQRLGADEGQRRQRQGDTVVVVDRLRAAAERDRAAVRLQATALRMTPRAGILITGTEVLTGIISDRNGPWLSERLRELGVDAAMIEIVGDRPEDLLAALDYMAREGMAMIVTSGGLGPDGR